MTTAEPDRAARLRPPWDDHRGGRSVLVGWLITRLLMIAVLCTPLERFIVSDVYYYFKKITVMWSVGLPNTLNEYPTPVAWFLTLPYPFGALTDSREGYLVAYIVAMVALDGAFTFLLFRAGRRRGAAVDFWLVFVLLLGPLAFVRLDLIPAVLAGAALLYARTRPGLAGALTGLGAAMKLWPALLYFAFLAPRGRRRPLSWGFWGVGLGLALISLIAGGATRLLSPLTWQGERGLQIESIWATPVMIARAFDPDRWQVTISRYQAYEIFGTGVQAGLVAANLATVAGLVLIGVLFVRAFRVLDPSPRAIGLLVLAVVAITIVTNKTLSPQYVLWFGGPMAALLLVDQQRLRQGYVRDRDSAALNGLARQLLVLALLNQLVYPLLYNWLLYRFRNDEHLLIAQGVITVRNLALLVFTVAVCRATWLALGRPRRRPEPDLPLASL